MKLTDKEINWLISQIYSGNISAKNLPKQLYLKIAQHLENGIYEGYGKKLSSVAYDSIDYKALTELRTNIYLFSGAKTFNYVLETENLIVEGDKILSLKEFKARALTINDKYNKTWLEAEYSTSIQQAKNCSTWKDFEEMQDTFPLLRYVAYMDANTSKICADIHGTVKPVNDSFWSKYSPCNHYNCRCHLEPLQQNEAKISKTPIGIEEPNGVFATNVGQTNEVFNKEHPYFTGIPKEYKAFAKVNFNLPVPK